MEGQFCSKYEQEENQFKEILKTCEKATEKENQVILQIYYKIRKQKTIFIHSKPKSEATMRVYSMSNTNYTCDKGDCNSLQTYIGYTEQTLQDRFRQYQYVLKHIKEVHHTRESTNEILQRVILLYNREA